MAWGLGSSYVTWTLPQVSHRIAKDDLRAGDILLNIDEHVLIFESWANSERTYYNAYEETPPQAVYHVVEYPYWSGSGGVYLPYRLNGYVPPNNDDDNNSYGYDDNQNDDDDSYGSDDDDDSYGYYDDYYYDDSSGKQQKKSVGAAASSHVRGRVSEKK